MLVLFVQAVFYGLTQQLPDRSIVHDLCSVFLDAMYSLPTDGDSAGLAHEDGAHAAGEAGRHE